MNIRRRVLPLTAAAVLLISGSSALAQTGCWASQQRFECGEPELISPNSWAAKTQCFTDHRHHIPPDHPKGEPWNHPIAYMHPQPVPEDKSLRIQVNFSGYNATPGAHCSDNNFAEPGKLVIKPCAGHYPDVALHDGAKGWWGWYKGNSNSKRLAQALNESLLRWPDAIDPLAGVTFEGGSYGGGAGLYQSMLLKHANPFWGNHVAIVRARVPETLPVKNAYPSDAFIQAAWEGQDLDQVDFRVQSTSKNVQNTYYSVVGSVADTSVNFDLEFFEICNRDRVSCYGMWHNAGHNTSEPDINLPFNETFEADDQDARLDQILPVFTNSSANHWDSTRGHYNLGLSWNSGGLVDNANTVTVPLKYSRHTGIGGDVPDQPEQVTFDLTLRRIVNLPTEPGTVIEYELGEHVGAVVVKNAGEVHIEGLQLTSSDEYSALTLRVQVPGVPIVYVEAPRSTDDMGEFGDNLANWDPGWDIGRLESGMGETRIMIEYEDGSREQVDDCLQDPVVCVVEDPKVSPDGKKVIYWKGIGDAMVNRGAYGLRLPVVPRSIYQIGRLQRCHLWEYDTRTKARTQLTFGNHCDRTPEYIDDDTFVFATNRSENYVPLTPVIGVGGTFDEKIFIDQGKDNTFYPHWGYEIYKGWRVEKGIARMQNLTPHECLALNPEVRSDGIIMYSSSQVCGIRGTLTSSPRNNVYIAGMDTEGRALNHAILGFHGSPPLKGEQWMTDTQKVLRAIQELAVGQLAVTNYYRSNHPTGLGGIWMLAVHAFEGVRKAIDVLGEYSDSKQDGSAKFAPPSLQMMVRTAQSQDAMVMREELEDGTLGRSYGKVGHPAAHPDYYAMITWGRGSCTILSAAYNTREAMGGEPTCQKVVAGVKRAPVTDNFDPDQIEIISQHPDWHRWNAQPFVAYQRLFGKKQPDQAPPIESELPPGKALLQIVNAFAFEAPPQPHRDYKPYREAYQGNVDADYVARAKQFCVDYWTPHKTLPKTRGRLFQERECGKIFGDGSVALLVDAERPLQMLVQGEHAHDVPSRDHSNHSLREGEVKTCSGCHDAHGRARAALYTETAEERFKKTEAYQHLMAMHTELGITH